MPCVAPKTFYEMRQQHWSITSLDGKRLPYSRRVRNVSRRILSFQFSSLRGQAPHSSRATTTMAIPSRHSKKRWSNATPQTGKVGLSQPKGIVPSHAIPLARKIPARSCAPVAAARHLGMPHHPRRQPGKIAVLEKYLFPSEEKQNLLAGLFSR